MKRLNPGHIEEVIKVFGHESVLPWVTDDGFVDLKAKLLSFLHSPGYYFLSPREGTIVMFIPMNYITYDAHIASLSRTNVIEDAMDCGRWMVENTPLQKIVAMVPTFNKVTIAAVRKSNMKKEGLLKKSFLKDNKLYDIEIYGIMKEELCQ